MCIRVLQEHPGVADLAGDLFTTGRGSMEGSKETANVFEFP